jgi:nucleotide-binding universal stress UspA family protein
MPDVKRILMPTDFSPVSEIAFRYAIDLGRKWGAAVHLLHVLDPPSSSAYPEGFIAEPPGLHAAAIDEPSHRLKHMLAVSAAAGVTTTLEVRVGRPVRTILDAASARGSDLIVMGTHGRGRVVQLFLGSVAEGVVRSAPCPVLTVREASRVADLMMQDAGVAQQA